MASSLKLVVAFTVVAVLCHGYFEVVANSFEVRLNNTAPPADLVPASTSLPPLLPPQPPRYARHRLAISAAPRCHPVEAASSTADPWPLEPIPTESRPEEPASTEDSTSSSFYRRRQEASRSVGRSVWPSTTWSPPLQPSHGTVPKPCCSRLRRYHNSPPTCSSSPASPQCS
jgi:hypothetical protein